MENWTGTSGTNISGTTDLAPLEDQAQMLLDLFPDARTWACSTALQSPTPSTR